MAKKKKPNLVPPALACKVSCTAGHKLSGLFVIFKLLPSEGTTKEQKLARILEATPHPGNPPIEPQPLTPEQKANPAAKQAYKEAKIHYEKDKKAWDEAKALYDAALDKETPPDPADQFVLGIVNHEGYLVPVHASYNPWYDVVTTPGRDPDAYKLLAGEKYEACLLRHPSPVLARALTRHLNKQASASDAKYGFSSWGALTQTIEVTSVSVRGGVETEIRLSEDPADYVPKGADAYGKWVIYRSMPHRYCSALTPYVNRVLEDLGRLRYPIGSHGSPYKPMDFNPNPSNRKNPSEKEEEGGFDRQAQAATARFQEHVNEGKAFVLTYKNHAQGGADWVYVLGKPFDMVTAAEALKWAPLSHPSFMLGVIDVETAACIEHWITKGLRKPHEVLLPSVLGRGIWMLERGEIALTAWSMLAQAFGCEYGIKPSSSLRSVRVFAWSGAINNSVHKTGLAVDMSGGADRNPSNEWPIRYEASWLKNDAKAKKALAAAEKEVAKAKAAFLKKETAGLPTADELEALKKAETNLQQVINDDADSRFNWRMRWRVYGHSNFDVFSSAKRMDEIARLKTAIAAYAGLPDPMPGLPRGELWKAIKQKFKSVDGIDVDVWIDEKIKPFVEYARTLLAMEPEELIDTYFRKEVNQFIPNPYESDGGTTSRTYRPSEGDHEYSARSWAKSWINLSAIGYPCQMERIGPHSLDIRDQVWVHGKDAKKARFKTWSMSGFFSTTKEEDADLVLMLSDITASEASAPQLKHRDTLIPVIRADSIVATYKPAELDGTFIKEWKNQVLKLDSSLRPRVGKKGGNTDAGGAQIALTLSATNKGKEKIQAAIDTLSKQFANKNFVIMKAGELAKLDVSIGVLMTGSALAAKLKTAMTDFEAQATANAKKKAAEEAANNSASKPPVKTKSQIAAEKKAAAAEEKKLITDWTVVIQPVFPKKPDIHHLTFLPDDSIVLPPGSNAAHLEWWHFQHRSAESTWGSLLEECGYSLKVMTVPLDGEANADGIPVHLGLGYTEKEIKSKPGGFNEGAVENRDPISEQTYTKA